MLVPIESAYATSYSSVIVILVLSCTVSKILQVFCPPDPTPIPPNFWGVPVGPGCRCWVIDSRCLKLFGREIFFEVFQPTCRPTGM